MDRTQDGRVSVPVTPGRTRNRRADATHRPAALGARTTPRRPGSAAPGPMRLRAASTAGGIVAAPWVANPMAWKKRLTQALVSKRRFENRSRA